MKLKLKPKMSEKVAAVGLRLMRLQGYKAARLCQSCELISQKCE